MVCGHRKVSEDTRATNAGCLRSKIDRQHVPKCQKRLP